MIFKTNISYLEIWKIAYPIILGSVAQNILNITDTAFLGRVGEIELGAGAIGGIYYYVIIMLGWGFGIGTQIIVARRNGETHYSEIGRTLDHGLFFLLPVATIMFVLIRLYTGEVLENILESDAVIAATAEYIKYRSFGLFFEYTNILFRAFYVGIGKTKVIIMTTSIVAVINILLDYCLIFGNLGFPEMGIGGAALASMIAESCATAFFFIYTFMIFPSKRYELFHFRRFDRKLYFRIIRVSLPMMLQNFLSLASWLAFFLFVEKMGERELAVSNVVRSFYMILMIPVWGFASATNTLVSFLIGSKREDQVISLVSKTMVIGIAATSLMVIISSFLPELAARIYTDDPALIREALPVIYVVNVSAVLLAGSFIIFSAVSGTGKTQVSLALEVTILVAYLIYVYLMVMVFKADIVMVWTAEILYGLFLGIVSYIYLKTGRWKTSKV